MPTDSVSQLNCSNSSASQVNDSVASSVTSIQFDTFGPEDRFVHDGRQYVRASKVQIPNKTNRKASKSSSIWEFNSSHQHANGSEWLRLKDHTLHWRCEHCIRKRKRTEVYSTSTDVNVTDLPAWWSNQEAQSQDPGLVKLAYDMLAIPAMSASCERLFSSAKLLLTDVRNRLDADHIEANECLKAWMNKSS